MEAWFFFFFLSVERRERVGAEQRQWSWLQLLGFLKISIDGASSESFHVIPDGGLWRSGFHCRDSFLHIVPAADSLLHVQEKTNKKSKNSNFKLDQNHLCLSTDMLRVLECVVWVQSADCSSLSLSSEPEHQHWRTPAEAFVETIKLLYLFCFSF